MPERPGRPASTGRSNLTAGEGIPYDAFMKVVELRELTRHNPTLHYFREYSGKAVLEGPGRSLERLVSFSIEKKPFGAPEILARFEEDPEWPLLPLIASLKTRILEMDKEGYLP